MHAEKNRGYERRRKNASCFTKKGFLCTYRSTDKTSVAGNADMFAVEAGIEVKHLTKQHPPDFLLTWRSVSGLRDVFMPDLSVANLVRANGQEALSEAEALQCWLADGGGLDVASRYGLTIIAGDGDLNRFSQKIFGEKEA